MSDLPIPGKEQLFTAILRLNTPEECAAFLEDICTIKELTDLSQRLEAARRLDRGESYQTISQELGLSTATIGRVSRCLRYGSGGYRLLLDRLAEETL